MISYIAPLWEQARDNDNRKARGVVRLLNS